MPSQTDPIAKFSDHKDRLWELYQKCRFHALACDQLMRQNMRIERIVRWATVIAIAAALAVGSVSWLAKPALAPLWACISVLATVCGIISLIVGSGAKQFHWFASSQRLESLANEVELFSDFVKLGKITENELLSRFTSFTKTLEDTFERAGMDLKERVSKKRQKLESALNDILKAEKKI